MRTYSVGTVGKYGDNGLVRGCLVIRQAFANWSLANIPLHWGWQRMLTACACLHLNNSLPFQTQLEELVNLPQVRVMSRHCSMVDKPGSTHPATPSMVLSYAWAAWPLCASKTDHLLPPSLLSLLPLQSSASPSKCYWTTQKILNGDLRGLRWICPIIQFLLLAE